MSALQDIFNAGIEKTSTVLVADPIGTYSKRLDEKLATAAGSIGAKIGALLGYRVTDQVADAAKEKAAVDRPKPTDTSTVISPLLEGSAASAAPIVVLGLLLLLLWRHR